MTYQISKYCMCTEAITDYLVGDMKKKKKTKKNQRPLICFKLRQVKLFVSDSKTLMHSALSNYISNHR